MRRRDRLALPVRLSRAVATPLHSGTHLSRRAYIVVGAVLVLGMASGLALTAIPGTNGSTLAANHTPFQRGNAQFRPLDRSTPPLASATAAPLPAPTSVADAAPLRPHEVFGFAPYWTLSSSSGFDVNGLTTVAYFNVDVNADGTLNQSGAGWDGLQSQAFTDLANRAHAAGDRVVLTAGQFDQGALDQLTSSPTAPATLAAQLTSIHRVQEPRRRQLRPRGGGERRPDRFDQPDHPGVEPAACRQPPLAGDRGHLCQLGR